MRNVRAASTSNTSTSWVSTAGVDIVAVGIFIGHKMFYTCRPVHMSHTGITIHIKGMNYDMKVMGRLIAAFLHIDLVSAIMYSH